MRLRFTYIPIAVCSILFLASCASSSTTQEQPILLGDSSVIVTETDSAYLHDVVLDVSKVRPAGKDTIAIPTDTPVITTVPPADTTIVGTKAIAQNEAKEEETPQADEQPSGSGLAVVFKQISVFIPDIKTRTYKKQNTQNANSVTYQLTNGTLNGKQIRVSGGTVQEISQKVQTIVIAKNELGTLPLESLTTTSGWETLRGNKNVFTIDGLKASELPAPKVSTTTIRNAVAKAARSQRMKKATEQKWLSSLKNVRSARQKPLRIALRSVTWKIEGKDAKGRAYQKQIRIDIPTP